MLAVRGGRRGSGHQVVNGVLLGLVVAVLLAVTVTAAVIVRRVLPARTTDGPRTTTRVLPEPATGRATSRAGRGGARRQ